MKKNITFKITILAAILSSGGAVWASDFNLDSMSAADIRAGQIDFQIATPQAEAEEDMIGVCLNISVPFKTIKNAVGLAVAAGTPLTIIDPAAPVVSKTGEFLKVSNIRVDAGGIIVNPTLTLKPYLEGRDKLAIRIQRVQLHASTEPSVKAAPALNQEEIMEQVMDAMIKGVYAAINEKLKAKQIPLKAEDVLTMNYDKTAWTLHATVSSRIMREFIPAALTCNLHLTGLTITENAITLKIQTAP